MGSHYSPIPRALKDDWRGLGVVLVFTLAFKTMNCKSSEAEAIKLFTWFLPSFLVKSERWSMERNSENASVRRNKRADRLSGEATMESGRSMERWDIMHAICEASRENDSSNDIESLSMNRLFEHHVRRGTAREESFSGSQRRIVNQHRTGVVGRWPLRGVG
jgi:hypothetical protein